MSVEYPIYEDTVIAVKLFAEDETFAERQLFYLALRYLPPQDNYRKDGSISKTINIMGGETDWFIVPHTFGVAIAKTLIEQKVTGLTAFSEDGFSRMISWLIEMEEINDAMCY